MMSSRVSTPTDACKGPRHHHVPQCCKQTSRACAAQAVEAGLLAWAVLDVCALCAAGRYTAMNRSVCRTLTQRKLEGNDEEQQGQS